MNPVKSSAHIITLLIILVALVIVFGVTSSLVVSKPSLERDLSVSLPSLTPPSLLKINLASNSLIATEAWTTFENYLEFSRTHNLKGVRSLSHQISETCNDPSKEKECFALMDGVYNITKDFKLNDFKYIQFDDRQIMMNTDGPRAAILYFTRDETGNPKVLGLRFCFEDEAFAKNCVETDPSLRDRDGNGWWDDLESLFY